MKFQKIKLPIYALIFLLTSTLQTAEPPVIQLRLLETTDIHVHLMNYDYYADRKTDTFGLAMTASLIREARKEAGNSMLFDNGDLLQGNPLGDFVARGRVLRYGETHPVYKAMNLLGYDAANIGNHEFNYGLDFLLKSLAGADFPYINSNVYVDDHDENPDNDQNYFQPYVILDRQFKDESGTPHNLKIGVIGFVPPQIMNWDRRHLDGIVIAKPMVDSAKKFVPQMKAAGADIIVAVPHSGLYFDSKPGTENMVHMLSQVEHIDAILFGHSHSIFPSKKYKHEGVDLAKGTIFGVPAVMPGFWGSHLGIVDLTLKKQGKTWKVADSRSEARPIYERKGRKTTALVEPDSAVTEAVRKDHEETLAFVRRSVGKTSAPITSYFALIEDDPSIQIVTNAQKWYVEQLARGTEYEGLPILSAGAPFKSGGRGGVDYYTDVQAGPIAIRNAADMYLYPNTLMAVLLTGSQVREWLERATIIFNQIDPNKTEEQPLIGPSPSYNFDVIDGVTYEVDVTQPPRYAHKVPAPIHPEAHRIKNLRFEGQPVRDDQKFIVATNNYRATGGGVFPGLDGSTIVIRSPNTNRQVLINYIFQQKLINPSADGNWKFVPISGKVKVSFETGIKARVYAAKNPKLRFDAVQDNGFAKYFLDMN